MEMTDDLLKEFARMMQLGTASGSDLSGLAQAHEDIGKKFAGLDRVRAAAIFGGLLTVPELHSNSLRLEALIPLSLDWAEGERKPSEAIIAQAFSALGSGWCGQMEDPVEGVFVGSVATPRGNFRILNGIWETPAFWLQRVVNVVEGMPPGGGYDELRERMYALLKLSDLVCERAGLHRNNLGNELREKTLNRKILSRLNSIEARVRFDAAELEQAGISIEALSAFFLMPEEVPGLLNDSLGHTALERHPIIPRRGQVHLVLPTAVFAIRQLVWTRLSFVMGELFPSGTPFDPATELAMQKAFFDHMWDLPLTEMIDHLADATAADLDIARKEQADSINEGVTAWAHTIDGFPSAFAEETRGTADLMQDVGIEILRDMAVRKQVTPLPGDNPQDVVEVRAMIAGLLRQPAVQLKLRTAYINAAIHAAIRANRGRKFKTNDLLDFDHAAAALGYCDAFFTDAALGKLLTREPLQFDQRFNCPVAWTSEEALQVLA